MKSLITAGTVEKTILGSDFGQNKNPYPFDRFPNVVEMCLDIGYSDAEIRRMIGGNACELMGLEQVREDALQAAG